MQQTNQQEVLYRMPELVRITGKGRSTLYADIKAGTFPRPVRLGIQSVAWRKSDIDRWIADRPVAQ